VSQPDCHILALVKIQSVSRDLRRIGNISDSDWQVLNARLYLHALPSCAYDDVINLDVVVGLQPN